MIFILYVFIFNNFSWDTSDYTIIRNIFCNYGIGSYFYIISNFNISNYYCSYINCYIVSYCWNFSCWTI